MRTLLQARLPLSPSVNNRTIITRRGGFTPEHVKKFQEDCEHILLSDETWQDGDAIAKARDNRSCLFVIVRTKLYMHLDPTRPAMYSPRDVDNMNIVLLNVLKTHLGIDDSFVVDLWASKRPLRAKRAPYLIVTVLEMEQSALFDDDEDEDIEEDSDYQPAPMLRLVKA